MTARRALLFWAAIGLVPMSAEAIRERQALEAFDLGRLRFVGFYPDGVPGCDCKPMASVRDPKGYLHRVFIGDYVGRNYGRVVEISAEGLRLLEAAQRSDGEWVQREVWLKSGSNQ